ALLMVATGISAAAILRAGARVFLGWGPRDDPLLSPEPPEQAPAGRPSVPLMVGATAFLVFVGLLLSIVPGLQNRTEQDAAQFMDRQAYVAHVLEGRAPAPTPPVPIALHPPTAASVAYGIGAGLLAVAAALFGLYRRRIPKTVRRIGTLLFDPPVQIGRASCRERV